MGSEWKWEGTHSGSPVYRAQWDSLGEYQDLCESLLPCVEDNRESFAGVRNHKVAVDYARHGWQAGVNAAMPIVDSALQLIDQELPVNSVELQWGPVGSAVDIGNYLSGRPDTMIRFTPLKVSKVGRVVVLCINQSASAAVKPETLVKRGAVIVALAMALEERQHSVEIWLDHFCKETGNGYMFSRVLLKGAEDTIDPAVLSYWIGHPASLRVHGFAKYFSMGPAERKMFRAGTSYSTPVNKTIRDLPEGTIYIDGLQSASDVPHADTFIRDSLRQIGLVPD